MKNAKAFTLAETLIALTIIGIIAAITLPTLIQRTQKQEFVSGLKKAYSTLSQITNQIIAEEGSPKSTSSTSNDGWAHDSANIYNLYKSHLNILKDCGSNAGCFAQNNNKIYVQLNGDDNVLGNIDSNNNYKKLISADGMQMSFHSASSTCENDGMGSYKNCGIIIIDINGEKQPNKWGRDVFSFVIKENGLNPSGCGWEDCNPRGYTCACKVLREGAMNY